MEVTLIGWTDLRRPSGNCHRCGRKIRLRGADCTLRYVSARLLEESVIEAIRAHLFTPVYIRTEVHQANALLARQSTERIRKLHQAEASEAAARKVLENLADFIAAHGPNPVIEGKYQMADREWRLAAAAIAEAKIAKRLEKPLRVTEAKAQAYADTLLTYMYEGNIELRRQFLAAFIRRIVLYDDRGRIELVEEPTHSALQAAHPSGQFVARGRLRNHLSHGPPLGVPEFIRTLRPHLCYKSLVDNNSDNN